MGGVDLVRARPSAATRRRSRGALLVLTMFVVAVIGVLLVTAGRVWHTEMQREKEADLLTVGPEIAHAIARYYAAAAPPQYPDRLDQLLLDARQPNVVRHLRRLYRDPMTGKPEWGLVKDRSNRIIGVYSLGKGIPLKQQGFSKDEARFSRAQSYADWMFIAESASSVPGGLGPLAPVPLQPVPLVPSSPASSSASATR